MRSQKWRRGCWDVGGVGIGVGIYVCVRCSNRGIAPHHVLLQHRDRVCLYYSSCLPCLDRYHIAKDSTLPCLGPMRGFPDKQSLELSEMSHDQSL